jgi:8-oxo-dGTP pyrophosphatase MutT (NUDIX family)
MNEIHPPQAMVQALLRQYGTRMPDDPALPLFEAFVAAHADCCRRELAVGHMTGSAWLVSADGGRVLLTHHRKLDRWLQLGGHADGDPDLARVALREAEEESGLPGLAVEGGIFDLDRHAIPARGDEPEHWHYDVRYVVRAGDSEAFAVSDESHALAWKDIGELAADDAADDSLRRMARKWLAGARGA